MESIPVLVTGGCGFLGTSIVSQLLGTKRFAITVIDINPPSLGSATFTASVRYVRANILDKEALQKVFNEARPSIVVHTAGLCPVGSARYSMKGKETVFKVNVEGTRNVVSAAKECGAKGLVYTSSSTVVFDELEADFRNVDEGWPTGRAKTSYGISKTLAEEIALSANTHDFATCALRPAPVFGPNDPGCIPIIHSCIAAAQTPFVIGSGTNLQDYAYVDNVADAHVLAVSNLLNCQTAAGEAIFISNGQPVTLRQLCIAVWKHFGHIPKYQIAVPEGLAWWLGLGFEWTGWIMGTEGPLSRGLVSDGCRDRYMNLSKARRLLGYRAKVNLDEGLRISCEHYRRRLEGQQKR
ncbi:similar to C-3 sterol dehydrogenase/C-4 decarboxylase [Plenodomus lingam JN3]|uniref:Similar to C-3 sterol dehydrogenase/C-4 decarboxylase n=1 Tax=Leptosphaeria maculans (strain JN3 / isolate v23.1.3 / race Av1-4-5-6-7-8) TaxID=985895 RepID=E4ZFS8_LEPMJ|nr:similar to C-3 sterol dehydrogenase/C-4 decarboxylase [Plenodomus lingam JN3]CBX90148.1 similar to C-3 sterol dehydrogenase/C-4 decarboxylase [Plenodomus lingam JN3]